MINQIDTDFIKIVHVNKNTAFCLAQIHQRTYIIVWSNNRNFHIRFFYIIAILRSRKVSRVINFHNLAVSLMHLINYRRRSSYDRKVVFSFQSFLCDFHMEHTQKTASKPKPESAGCFRLKSN